MPLFVILEQMANGLLVGAYYIVLALGLSLIFSLGGVVNLAHGAFYALGAYLGYEIQRRLGFGGAMALSPIGVALIGVAIERLAIRRFYKEDPRLALSHRGAGGVGGGRDRLLAPAQQDRLRPGRPRRHARSRDGARARHRAEPHPDGDLRSRGRVGRPGRSDVGAAGRRAPGHGHGDPRRRLRHRRDRRARQLLGRGVGGADRRRRPRAHGALLSAGGRGLDVRSHGPRPARAAPRAHGRALRAFRMSVVARLRHPLVALAAALLLLPQAMRAIGMTEGLATEVAIFALVGLGFNLLLGYTGLLSFGHGAFFGLAAYAAALLQIHYLPGHVLVPIVFGTLFAALMGLVLGFLALRRRGVYFSLLTLAFTALIFSVVYRWTTVTGGENGLRGITRRSLLGLPIESQLAFYYLTAAIVLLVAWALWRVVHSPLGRVLLAIRDNERRARFLGYPVQRYKLIAFPLSATVTGLGGCPCAFLKVFAAADLVHVAFSGEIVAMTIVGGMGHFLGPALGSAFFILFRELLSEHTASWQFWFGLMFMGFILFSPSGLIGLGERLLRPFRRRDEEAAGMAARLTPRPATEVPDFLRGVASAAGTLLDCRMVTKRFGDFTAVDSVDLALADRRLHALIGPNGAGKTTLFNAVSGMYPPDGGSIVFAGRRIDGLSPERVVGQGIARSFQITNLL